MTLIEAMVGLVVMAVGLMSLMPATFLALRQTTRAKDDVQYWADVQQVTDSITAKGWNNVTGGSATVRGRAITWAVTGANPQKITLVAKRYGYMQPRTLTQDTVVFYLSNPAVK